MSALLDNFEIFSEICDELKESIKIFHIFRECDKSNGLFITNDDKVFSYGNNEFGKCGFPNGKSVGSPQIIPRLCGENIKEFFIAENFVLALNHSRRVFGWGMNELGQLGRGYDSQEYLKPQIISSLNNIIQISCGLSHSLALTSDGKVYAWGWNGVGQVGCGIATDKITKPMQLKSLKRIKFVHCFYGRSYAVTFDGLVYSWGWNQFYQLGHQSNEDIFEPKLVKGLFDVLYVCCSDFNTYFLTKYGKIYFCGQIETNCEEKTYQKWPEMLKSNLKFQSIHSINYYSSNPSKPKALALSQGFVYCLRAQNIFKTKYKTFFDYCLNEYQVTHETIVL